MIVLSKVGLDSVSLVNNHSTLEPLGSNVWEVPTYISTGYEKPVRPTQQSLQPGIEVNLVARGLEG